LVSTSEDLQTEWCYIIQYSWWCWNVAIFMEMDKSWGKKVFEKESVIIKWHWLFKEGQQWHFKKYQFNLSAGIK